MPSSRPGHPLGLHLPSQTVSISVGLQPEVSAWAGEERSPGSVPFHTYGSPCLQPRALSTCHAHTWRMKLWGGLTQQPLLLLLADHEPAARSLQLLVPHENITMCWTHCSTLCPHFPLSSQPLHPPPLPQTLFLGNAYPSAQLCLYPQHNAFKVHPCCYRG